MRNRKQSREERIAEVERELASKSTEERLLETIARLRRKQAEAIVRRERSLWRRLFRFG